MAENFRAGLVASAVYNTLRQKRADKVWEPKDFFQFDEPTVEEKRATAEELIGQMDALVAFVAKN